MYQKLPLITVDEIEIREEPKQLGEATSTVAQWRTYKQAAHCVVAGRVYGGVYQSI